MPGVAMVLDKERVPFDMCCMGREGGETNKTQSSIL
ncbi:hypothetical protein COLO4_19795 [Corchorus olitorius]|uniref:Uncharacterized protein n=1 Tax=Corchorus olitorius TaxID=93759 RepID=A0A1R3J3E8_9ROSI|nr:hypothetical protein COLO4_19795 [Corchorus olitorius]